LKFLENGYKTKTVMIIAGDVSGDLHGSKLVRAMREKEPNLFFFGIGGKALRDAGVKILVDTTKLSVIGVTETFSKLPAFVRAMLLSRTIFKRFRPDLLILIDFPGFNLPVSALAKRYHVNVLYYIGPQVWAWRPGRVKKIRKRVDRMAVILPFEEDFFKSHRVPVTFVGHPLMDTYCSPELHMKSEEEPFSIGLLPGSREREVTHLFPVMLEAANLLRKRLQPVRFLISVAQSVDPAVLERLIEKHAPGIECALISDGVHRVFSRCRFCIVVSGTATLEAAVCGMPMVIIYKVSPITYWLGRSLVKVRHIGLVNIIAGKTIVPELIQQDASAERIAETVCRMLQDVEGLKMLKQELASVRNRLGGPGASQRAAEVALGML
jgi:lipid-A-disaccharide synthase